jgi:hypothetical protein
VRGKVFGALFGSLDAIVEPMQVPGAIQTWLGSREGYRLLAGRTVASVSSGAVVDHTGARTEADVVVVCPGDVFTGVVDLSRAPLRRVRLQMMQTAPFDRRLTTSIADADSLRYYPAYAEAPLARLGPQAEVAAAHAMQLLVAQRLDGGLTIGDTHAYEEPFDFALDEEPYGHLTRQAERILGSPLPSIVRRWAGVY